MKNISSSLPKSKFLLACALASLAAGTASAQVVTLISPTVQDGGFESITAKANFNQTDSTTGPIPYWGATLVTTAGTGVGAPGNTGAETGAPATTADNSATHSGAAGSFYQPGSSTAFNLATGHTTVLGDVYTVTWFGRKTGANGQQALTLFTQSPTDTPDPTAFLYNPLATVLSVNGTTNTTYALAADRSYVQYTATYTAAAADVGNYVGFTIGNSGTDFIGEDDFTLTVTAATVPEPSTYAFICAGVVGLWFVNRSRRALNA